MEETKICDDCKTSKTPLWRSGPAGPKSLCNACGIRFRKKRSVVKSDKKKPLQCPSPTSTSSTVSKNRVVVNTKKNMRIKVVLLQRQRSPTKKVKRQKIQNHQFGEVEEAAFLLMSLSCGSVFG